MVPFPGAIAIIAILTMFASGAAPLNNTKPVDFQKLKQGQAIYKVNR
jgi:hypothetical protein